MIEFLKKGAGYCMSHGVELAMYYKEITGKDICTTCQQVLYNAYFELKKLIPMGIFKFKGSNSMIMVHGSSVAYTQANITDEIAAGLIASNANYANSFEPYGPEGEKLIEAAKKGVKMVEKTEAEEKGVARDYKKEFPEIKDLKTHAKERGLSFANSANYEKVLAMLLEADK